MTIETVAPVAAEPVVAPVVVAPVAPAAPVAPITIGTPPVAPMAPVVAPVTIPAATAVVYDPTGDAGLDVALSFVGNLGITMDHPAMAATANGDFSLIKAHLATMGDKARGWEQMVALAEGSHTRAVEAANTKATTVTNAVHETAGGAENWKVVSAWAGQNATEAEKAELNAMFNAGPVQARAAAAMLMELHSKAAGVIIKPASAVGQAGTSGATAASNTGPLTGREYSDAVNALAKRIGSHTLHNSPEYAALGKRLQLAA